MCVLRRDRLGCSPAIHLFRPAGCLGSAPHGSPCTHARRQLQLNLGICSHFRRGRTYRRGSCALGVCSLCSARASRGLTIPSSGPLRIATVSSSVRFHFPTGVVRAMRNVVAIVASILLAGATWLYLVQPLVSASFKATPVATVSGTVKSLKVDPSAAVSLPSATVQLADGTIVEASVPGACPVWVGQVTNLAVFQPAGIASRVYVVTK